MRKYAGSNIVQLLIGELKSQNENINTQYYRILGNVIVHIDG